MLVSWCKTYCLPSGGKIGVHNAMWKRVGEETKLAFKCKLKDERREQREVVERLGERRKKMYFYFSNKIPEMIIISKKKRLKQRDHRHICPKMLE